MTIIYDHGKSLENRYSDHRGNMFQYSNIPSWFYLYRKQKVFIMVGLQAGIKTTLDKSVSTHVENLIYNILLEGYGQPDVGNIAVEKVKQQIKNTPITDTVDGIEPDIVIDTIYTDVSSHRVSDDGIQYQIGWFNETSARLAAMLEYGVHVDTNLVTRRQLLSPLIHDNIPNSLKNDIVNILKIKLKNGIAEI